MTSGTSATVWPERRFVWLEHVQEALSISRSQAYVLVRTRDLRTIPVDGRGQWRVKLTELDAYYEHASQAAESTITDETE